MYVSWQSSLAKVGPAPLCKDQETFYHQAMVLDTASIQLKAFKISSSSRFSMRAQNYTHHLAGHTHTSPSMDACQDYGLNIKEERWKLLLSSSMILWTLQPSLSDACHGDQLGRPKILFQCA
ncbi:hypothetical protein VNO77_20155 [Canavalia gladiata]|uniref:Uncharacterized protein n=1 Tax=Canavalia gladiata TaxID=3824 RepID=A0AAN9QL24_CANGL